MEEALLGFALSIVTLATCFLASEDSKKKKNEMKVDKTMGPVNVKSYVFSLVNTGLFCLHTTWVM